MFGINFFCTKSETNAVTKTYETLTNFTYQYSMAYCTGDMRAPLDPSNPIILIDVTNIEYIPDGYTDPLGWRGGVDSFLTTFNYANIPTLGNRFYFITGHRIINSTLIELTLKVDVLRTYRDNILGSQGYIERCEFFYDPFIEDDYLPFKYNESIIKNPISTDYRYVNVHFDLDVSGTGNRHFLLTTLVNLKDVQAPVPAPFEGDELTTSIPGLPSPIKTRRWGEAGNVAFTYCLTYTQMKEVAEIILKNDALRSYVMACVSFPFDITTALGRTNVVDTIIFGTTKAQRLSDQSLIDAPYYAYSGMMPPLIIGYFNLAGATSYLDYEPYKTYRVYIPFVGETDLEARKILGKEVYIYYSVSPYTGDGTCNIYNATDELMIQTIPCKVGHAMSIATTNFRELQNERNANTLSTFLSMVGGVLSVGGGLASNNPMLVAGGALSVVNGLTKSAVVNMSQIDRGSISIPDAVSGLQTMLTAKLITRSKVPTIDNADRATFAHEFGFPMKKTLVLGLNNFGFSIIPKVHLWDLACPKKERDEIEELLRVGVILGR